MPLRRLELQNFKSYRGQQVIEFGDAPFTCIIGPNGSGKSNLMDAISFVLGVKSAQLRSAHLKDLVYRGRKAGVLADIDTNVFSSRNQNDAETDAEGAELGENDAKTAAVTAVYEDTDGTEWRFKRTIATTGASAYYLQGRIVTWTVYNMQLEKFNILVKAKNFLVFQGDVEGVASQDSRALSRLIDRISGSMDLALEYNKAKEEQDRAAEAANANNAKKRSMITERKHFEVQTAEIRQWQALCDEKDETTQRWLLWKLYHIFQGIDTSSELLDQAAEDVDQLREAIIDRAAELKQARRDHAEMQLAVSKRETRAKEADKAAEEARARLVAVQTQITHSERKATSSSSLLKRVRVDRERQAGVLADLEKGAAAIRESMEAARERQRKKSVAKGAALSEEDLAEYRQLRADANLTIVAERQDLDKLRRQQKVLRDGLTTVGDKIQQTEGKRDKLSRDIEVLEERKEVVSTKVQDLKNERRRLKTLIDDAEGKRQSIAVKETEVNDRLQEVLDKLIQAGAADRENERERQQKDMVQKLQRHFTGVHGRVVDLCKPSATKFDVAVMTVLGRNIDSIIVDHEKTAIRCIQFLRQQRAFQATFLPLDTLQATHVPERLKHLEKARPAIECINYDAELDTAMQYVCGTAMVCDTIAVAKDICYQKNLEVKAVTLDGTVIHKSGLMTGGRGQKERKFDDVQVSVLKKKKDEYVQQLLELRRSMPKDTNDEDMRQDLARVEAELATVTDALANVNVRLESLRKEREAAKKDLLVLASKRDKDTRLLEDLQDEVDEVAAVVDAEDDKTFAAFCKRIKVANVREYEDVQLKAAQEENEAIEAFTTQIARVDHQITFEKAQLKSTEERVEFLENATEKERATAERLQSTKEEIEEEIESLQSTIDRTHDKLAKAKLAIENASKDVDAARKTARDLQLELDRRHKDISELRDEIERLSVDRHAVYRKCRLEDIELPLLSGSLDEVPIEGTEKSDDDAMDVDSDETPRNKEPRDFGIEPDFSLLDDEDRTDNHVAHGIDYEARIVDLKAQIERLMPNMKARDRLKEVNDELDKTETDMEKARRHSRETRDRFLEIKRRRCDLFNKTFAHMSNCIDKIYKDLTKNRIVPTGGMAFLSLENADEPYLGGVKYNTMPPGKRFVEIDQLSGGEKTMAALALLFSIHSYHPSPFFVLDEVDAALDATNVSKLARYLLDQAHKNVQFLIISLKSSLYQHADGLVGVYREQEENSSRTLSLDMRSYE